MEKFKKVNVLMLPTSDKSNLFRNKESNLLSMRKYLDVSLNNNIENLNLYFLNDEHIKEGDWYLWNDGKNHWLLNKGENKEYNLNVCKKIIATTDSSFCIDKECELYTAYPDSYNHVVPTISQEYIKYFIEQYNLGNIIIEVEVEYIEDEYYKGVIFLSEKEKHEYLVINPDNTINIKFPVEETWSDVESEFRKYRQSLDGVETISAYTYFLNERFNPPSPVEENLYTRNEVIAKIGKFYHDSRVYVNSSQIESVNTAGGFRAKWIKENL